MTSRLRQIAFRAAAVCGAPVVAASHAAYDTSATLARTVAVLPALFGEIGILAERFNVLIVRCARLVGLASFAAGALMAMQFGNGMARFGAKLYVPTVVASSVLGALGPMLASLMAAARSGGGLAAEIAGMKTTQQLDAIKALGSDPDRKLLAPSIVALTLGLPLLAVVADVCGLLGGLVIETTVLGLAPAQAWAKTIGAIQWVDTGLAVAKTSLLGLLIGVLSVREGLAAGAGTAGVGAATTAAIVKSTVAVLVADLFLTKLLWLVS